MAESPKKVKPGFHEATQVQEKAQASERLFHRENRVDASISKSASISIRIFPFPCACAYACVRLRRVKMKRSVSTGKFATSDQLKYSFQILRV